jgi:hypothetical protein
MCLPRNVILMTMRGDAHLANLFMALLLREQQEAERQGRLHQSTKMR